jgi:hypothetical protein
MHRTQIYLEPDLAEALDRLARQRGTSRAGLLRLAARRLVEQEAGQEEDPIFDLIGAGHGGRPGRTSEEHDRVLIEREIKSWSR